MLRVMPLYLIVIMLTSCYGLRPSKGGGQSPVANQRRITTTDIALLNGYIIEAIATGLTFPTGIAFDEHGVAYVIESGYSYDEVWAQPQLLRIETNGKMSVIARGEKNGPWNGITYHNGNFYVAEGGQLNGGKILRIDKSGNMKALVDKLPSIGDHHTNGPVVFKNFIYFGQGTATNSGVVGEDNANFGWLKRYPEFHDIPCKDVILRGKNYTSDNVLSEDKNDKATTGAFVPFNTSTNEGQVVKGAVPCTGSILRISIDGGEPELVAWGLRNPFGLTVYNEKLYVTENSYDDRGSRPVWGTGDVLWEVKHGQWYGWPDYSAGELINSDFFKVPGKDNVDLVLKDPPMKPPKPIAVLGVHSSSNGISFAPESFGFGGKAFIAQFGDMSPSVGKVLAPVGFKIVMVDVSTGVILDFAVNKGDKNGPASWLKKGGLERPVDVKFHPDGKSLYVVDFGIVEMSSNGSASKQGTGVIWKISKR